MAKKKAESKDMETATEITLKSVRLDLAPDEHRLLRLLAADGDASMAAFARATLVATMRDVAKRKGIKP